MRGVRIQLIVGGGHVGGRRTSLARRAPEPLLGMLRAMVEGVAVAGTGMMLMMGFAAAGAAGANPAVPPAPPMVAITTPAGSPEGDEQWRGLSRVEADAAIEAGAAAHIANPDDLAIGSPPNAIHGELGVAIGTGGARDLYGAATVPLGQNGSASVAVESSRSPRRHGW